MINQRKIIIAVIQPVVCCCHIYFRLFVLVLEVGFSRPSNGEVLVDLPVAACNVELVEILLLIIPAYSVQRVLDLEHHSAE